MVFPIFHSSSNEELADLPLAVLLTILMGLLGVDGLVEDENDEKNIEN
jgi:hypothetical protein